SFLQARLSRAKLFLKFPCRLQFRAPAHLNVLFLSPDSFQFHLKLQDLKFHITGFDPELFELEILRTTLRPVFSKVYGGILTTIFISLSLLKGRKKAYSTLQQLDRAF
ncbi:unnamed protein product, partial [Prunus brigantina]